jgi:hypothetical protein
VWFFGPHPKGGGCDWFVSAVGVKLIAQLRLQADSAGDVTATLRTMHPKLVRPPLDSERETEPRDVAASAGAVCPPLDTERETEPRDVAASAGAVCPPLDTERETEPRDVAASAGAVCPPHAACPPPPPPPPPLPPFAFVPPCPSAPHDPSTRAVGEACCGSRPGLCQWAYRRMVNRAPPVETD